MTYKYVVITPVRDEEAYLRSTIDSMLGQTLLPEEWIIVDDGSTDATPRIIAEAAEKNPWIRGIYRENRGFRKSGGGVVEAVNDGLRSIVCDDWDFVVKLDGDLAFEPFYFERCFEHFAKDPTLGVGGGVIYIANSTDKVERCPTFHVRGATKIYRRACWEAISPLWPAPGWDTIDEVKANMLGWRSESFRELHLVHYRVTGSADGRWGGWVKGGRANYISGYHPVFMLAKCARRLVNPKTLADGLALLYGFTTGYLRRIPRVNDPALIAYLRRQQLRRLFGMSTIWR